MNSVHMHINSMCIKKIKNILKVKQEKKSRINTYHTQTHTHTFKYEGLLDINNNSRCEMNTHAET